MYTRDSKSTVNKYNTRVLISDCGFFRVSNSELVENNVLRTTLRETRNVPYDNPENRRTRAHARIPRTLGTTPRGEGICRKTDDGHCRGEPFGRRRVDLPCTNGRRIWKSGRRVEIRVGGYRSRENPIHDHCLVRTVAYTADPERAAVAKLPVRSAVRPRRIQYSIKTPTRFFIGKQKTKK